MKPTRAATAAVRHCLILAVGILGGILGASHAGFAAPKIWHIEENTDESLKGLNDAGMLTPPNAAGDLIIPFAGGVDSPYAIYDTKADEKAKNAGDSFTLKDNGNGTTTLSAFFSRGGDTGSDNFTEDFTIRDAANKIVAVIRVDSPPEPAPEPASLAIVAGGLAGLAAFRRRSPRRLLRMIETY